MIIKYHVIITVDQVDGNTEVSQSEEIVSEVKSHQRKNKPAVKGFELFESLGLVMGVNSVAMTL